MAKALQKDLEFYRGRTYSRDFKITGFTDKVDDIIFTICQDKSHKFYCLRKSLGKGITVVDTGIDEKGKNYTTYNLLFEATDTDCLKAGVNYGYDIALYSGKRKKQLLEGSLKLLGTHTKTCNEC